MSDKIEMAKKLRRIIFGIPMMATEASHVEKEIAAFLAGEEDSLRSELAAWKFKAEKLEAEKEETLAKVEKERDFVTAEVDRWEDLSKNASAIIQEIEERLKAATPGPWEFHTADRSIRGPLGPIAHMRATCVTDSWVADAETIHRAPDDLRYLLAALRAEKGRHDFSIAKWMQERKELTDELVKTREKLAFACKDRDEAQAQWKRWESLSRQAYSDGRRDMDGVMKEKLAQVEKQYVDAQVELDIQDKKLSHLDIKPDDERVVEALEDAARWDASRGHRSPHDPLSPGESDAVELARAYRSQTAKLAEAQERVKALEKEIEQKSMLLNEASDGFVVPVGMVTMSASLLAIHDKRMIDAERELAAMAEENAALSEIVGLAKRGKCRNDNDGEMSQRLHWLEVRQMALRVGSSPAEKEKEPCVGYWHKVFEGGASGGICELKSGHEGACRQLKDKSVDDELRDAGLLP